VAAHDATLAELLAELDEVNEAIRDLVLGKVPLEGTVGRTKIGLAANLKALREYRDDLFKRIRVAKRLLGTLTPARREVY
jgi:hypothetical protein